MNKKAFTFAIALLVAALALAGCSGGPRTNTPQVNAQDTVCAAIDAFKEGDADGFYSCLYLSDSAAKEKTDPEQIALAECFGPKITYRIISAQEDIKTGVATVKVEIAHPDTQEVYDRTLELAQEKIPDPTKFTDTEIEAKSFKLFKKAAKEAEATETTTVTVDLGIVEDGENYVWKITNDTLYEPLFGSEIATEE